MAKIPFRMPDITNATPQHLSDELGKVKLVIKTLEKLEEFYKIALQARREGQVEINGESFSTTFSTEGRSFLNQGKVKAYLENTGQKVSDYYDDKDVDYVKSELLASGKPVTNQDLVQVLEQLFPPPPPQEVPPKRKGK